MRKLFYLVMFYFLHQINILSQNYIDVIGQNSGFGTSAPTGKLHVIVNSTQEEGVRISDGQNGNINIQPIEGGFYSGPSGFQAINFNGFYNNYGGNTGIGGESIYNTAKSRWRLVVDQRNYCDYFRIDIMHLNPPSNLSLGSPFLIGPDGNAGFGIMPASIFSSQQNYPKSRLQVSNGDIYIESATNGVIMKSPNGQCWRLTVSDTGTPVFSSITCP